MDTLSVLRAERPDDDLVLVVGSDTWPEMPGWREPERLFALAEVAVVDRPGEPTPSLVAPFPDARGVSRVEGPTLPISATMVRGRCAGRPKREIPGSGAGGGVHRQARAVRMSLRERGGGGGSGGPREEGRGRRWSSIFGETTDFTDFFVLLSGTNQRQLVAIADAVRDALRDRGGLAAEPRRGLSPTGVDPPRLRRLRGARLHPCHPLVLRPRATLGRPPPGWRSTG